MKNIFVLPTTDATRLKKVFGHDRPSLELSVGYCKWRYGVQVYITSDENVVDGDWIYYENGHLKGIHKVVNGKKPKTIILKKIILTTDSTLIAEGVQAIDDEFLEWFVKNGSCEFVEVKKVFEEHKTFDISYYKIIIPIKCDCTHFCRKGTLDDEIMYCEEDMKQAFKSNYTPFSASNIGDLDKDFSVWFNQFKKK
jgi:hypothetical protein